MKQCAFDAFDADNVGQLKLASNNLLAHVHVLDLHENGYIKPHVDALRFCGNTIAGLCLLSDAVMKLTHEKDESKYAYALLKRRSLYIMRLFNVFLFCFSFFFFSCCCCCNWHSYLFCFLFYILLFLF